MLKPILASGKLNDGVALSNRELLVYLFIAE